MKIDLSSGEICLRKGQLIRLHNAQGVFIHAVSGIVWITSSGNPKDVFLRDGETHSINEPGLVLVESIGPASIRVETTKWLKMGSGYF